MKLRYERGRAQPGQNGKRFAFVLTTQVVLSCGRPDPIDLPVPQSTQPTGVITIPSINDRPDIQGLAHFELCQGTADSPSAGYLLVTVEEKNERSFMHFYSYVASGTQIEFSNQTPQSTPDYVNIPLESHVAGLSISDTVPCQTDPYLYYVNFSIGTKGWIYRVPLFEVLSDKARWPKSVEEVAMVQAASGLAVSTRRHKQGQSQVCHDSLLVTRFYPGVGCGSACVMHEGVRGNWTTFPIAANTLDLRSQGAEFVERGSDFFLMHTYNGAGTAFLEIREMNLGSATQAPSIGEQLFKIRIERSHLIEEVSLTDGGWLLVGFEQKPSPTSDVFGVAPLTTYNSLSSATYAKGPEIRRSQRAFLNLLWERQTSLPPTLAGLRPPPFPFEDDFATRIRSFTSANCPNGRWLHTRWQQTHPNSPGEVQPQLTVSAPSVTGPNP